MIPRDLEAERFDLLSQLAEFRWLVAQLPEDELIMLSSARARIGWIESQLANLEAEMAASDSPPDQT